MRQCVIGLRIQLYLIAVTCISLLLTSCASQSATSPETSIEVTPYIQTTHLPQTYAPETTRLLQPTPTVISPSQNTERDLTNLLIELCWVAYSPTHFDPTADPIQWPSEETVREDLRVLRNFGFNGLVTYGSNYVRQEAPDEMLNLARLAQETGFAGVILGVWDLNNENELRNAEQGATYTATVGYCVGNEGLDSRYDLETLISVIERLRRSTGKPVSTTEQVYDYYENSPLWDISDWIFPNAHPYFAGEYSPQAAVAWTEKVYANLDKVSDKLLVFKEVGLPSGGDDRLSGANQAEYYRLLKETEIAYVVFEAFDAPWKHLHPQNSDGTFPQPDPEPHWGIFTYNREPKEVAGGICLRP